MSSINIIVETEVSRSARARQLEAMFDVPAQQKCQLSWSGDFPYNEQPWNVGLIVGPSGCGKSTILHNQFGEESKLLWMETSVIDDFSHDYSMDQISQVCQAVGFNTVPAWLRPFKVLSNGERFRVEMARRLLETTGIIVVDEFTSVVDRQVAQIGAHAVQKYVRKHGKQFVAASCHYDIVDWLQPDWILEPATMTFTRRLLQRRPSMEIEIKRVPYAAWQLFAPFHYLTNELHKAARCFGLFVGDQIAAFAALLHRPHPKVKDIMGISRLVTLPDWQGLGLAMILCDALGSAYKSITKRVHMYPAHPALIRSFDKSKNWKLEKKPGIYSSRDGLTTSLKGLSHSRPCAVFSYAGSAMDQMQARQLLQQ